MTTTIPCVPLPKHSLVLQASVLFLGGIILAGVVYGFTLSFGFDYDDYHLLRPYTWREVAATFTGTWDPSGVEVAFYRPLTSLFYAARFWMFGVDAWKYHALSLLMFAGAASLFGLFVSLATESRWVGALAVVAYVVHPAMPRSQVVWTTNQMHLLASLLVGSALVWWASCGRASKRWGWAIVLAVAALLVKEDGVMLLPLLVTLQLLWRALVDRRAPWPPAKWLALGTVALAGVLTARYFALGGLGGYSARPTLGRMWANYKTGVDIGFLVRRTDRWFLWPWVEPFALAVLALGALAGLMARHTRLLFLFLVGITGAALFNLPFVFVTKAEQYHLVASFSAVAVTAALAMLWRLISSAWWRVAVGTVATAGLVLFGGAARHRAELFTPYTPWTLGHDEIVLGWGTVPLEIRDWLAEGIRLRREPAIGRLSDLPVIVFGASDFENAPDGRRLRWIGERTTILPGAGVHALDLSLSALTPIKDRSYHVVVETDTGRVASFTLRDAESKNVRVALRQGRTLFPLSRRIIISVTPAWRMSDVSPSATDATLRTIRMGELRVF